MRGRGAFLAIVAISLGVGPWAADAKTAHSRSTVALTKTQAIAPTLAARIRPEFDRRDSGLKKVSVVFNLVARGLVQPTDIQFLPDQPSVAFVLEKEGQIKWVRPDTTLQGVVHRFAVRTGSEMGLLGIAFHPRFSENRKAYVNLVPLNGPLRTQIVEIKLSQSADPQTLRVESEKLIFEVLQPFPNHKGGQLQFGKDGYLYIGLGDGGSSGDPRGNGQLLRSYLGKILRIDVDRTGIGRAYAIPPDNPFVQFPGAYPEVWAWGLRNPWRFSFGPSDELIIADVGQDQYEEIDVLRGGKGANLGWNIREGAHCYKAQRRCFDRSPEYLDPALEYGREDGGSVTGGYVYLGAKIPALAKRYVFADFVSGRFWAADLGGAIKLERISLGRTRLRPSTFGRAANGEIYVADFVSGGIYRLESP